MEMHACPDSRKLGRLTQREREVLSLVVKGMTGKEIAALIAASPKSAAAHRRRIMAKLGIKDLTSMVELAIRNGTTEP